MVKIYRESDLDYMVEKDYNPEIIIVYLAFTISGFVMGLAIACLIAWIGS